MPKIEGESKIMKPFVPELSESVFEGLPGEENDLEVEFIIDTKPNKDVGAKAQISGVEKTARVILNGAVEGAEE